MNNTKDKRVKELTLKEFYEKFNYLLDLNENNIWKTKTNPKYTQQQEFFRLTSDKLVYLKFNQKHICESIIFALRDGKNEYFLLEDKIAQLNKDKKRFRSKYNNQILILEKSKNLLPEYKIAPKASFKAYQTYLKDTNQITTNKNYFNKYVVFDVESNGLDYKKDDLLSFALYDPTTGLCYERYLPLNLQPVVLTGFVNGLDEELLREQTHMSQEEFNFLVEKFDLNNKIILFFGGLNKSFDQKFLEAYLTQRGIKGFENFKYENIKAQIPPGSKEIKNNLNKDNLCKFFDIEGVSLTHNAVNDCILEWKLFEKLKEFPILKVGDLFYKYHEEYIIPITTLNENPNLIEKLALKVPKFISKVHLVASFPFAKTQKNEDYFIFEEINKSDIKRSKALGKNIEEAINKQLNVLDLGDKNKKFTSDNRSKLTELSMLNKPYDYKVENYRPKPTYHDNISPTNPAMQIINHIQKLIYHIKTKIFKNKEIKSQELSFSKDGRIYSLCDLSNDQAVLEIKTYDVIDKDGKLNEKIARQLYYQANGREKYLLSFISKNHETKIKNGKRPNETKEAGVYLYKVDLTEI